MKTLYMTKGLIACGKTTWAKEMQKANPNIVRVNKDDLREMLHAGKWSKGNEKEVLYIRDEIICKSLANGKHVIVDDTNFHPNHEKKLREFAEFNKAQFVIKDFTDVPLETCLKRDSAREKPIGKKHIMSMYNQYLKKNNEKPLNPLVFNDSLPYCAIFDLDGTLAHIHDRSPYDGKSCGSDLVNESIKSLFEMVQDHVNVIILSGRNGESGVETRAWLQANGINPEFLYMRAPGDSRKDSVIKKEIFDENIKDKYNVLFVVDDRNQMVDTWRSMDLTCLQCNYGDF